MPEQFFAACPSCGKQHAVRLTDAGTQRSCSACPATFTVPNSLKLKELSGDPYPNLRPIEKIRQALADRVPPFDGTCHGCNTARAEFVVPVGLHVMEERSQSGHGGLWFTPWFAVAHVPSGIEQWSSNAIPLLLCTACKAKFEADQRARAIRSTLKILVFAGIVSAIIWFAARNMEFVAFIAKPLAVAVFVPVLLIAKLKGFRQRSSVEDWVRRIAWVDDALNAEDEYTLEVRKIRPLRFANPST